MEGVEGSSRFDRKRRLQGMNTRHALVDSPLGELTLVADGDALIGVYFHHHWYRPSIDIFGPRVDDDALLTTAAAQLREFLVGDRTYFDVPTLARGDDLQRSIWSRLAAIPYGNTVTYGELADELADGTTAQQVGAAVGRNPLSIIVPCHRVVGKDGKLTGYAGGLERKKFLLDLEEPADVRAARLF
jgi:methylated-DNA-[protein]-cysteine S-methyltransferase